MPVIAGIDAQSTQEVTASLQEFGQRYLRRLYTEREIQDCGERPDELGRALAALFAAKEAVLKILDIGEDVPPWKAIEVLGTTNGNFVITLHGVAAKLARRRGIEGMSLSISYAAGVALAVVVAQSVDDAAET